MMSQTDHFQCYQGKNFKSISLPYRNDQKAGLIDPVPSMYVFLPEKTLGLAEFTRDIDNHKWEEMTALAPLSDDYLCKLVLPRFKVEYEETLNPVLEQLGFGEMFIHNKADLGGMFKNASDAFINQVKHKTFIEVNEERTEAAAVTGFTHATGGPPKKYFEMVVDRPFLFVIRDNKTGAILFMGSIYDPK